MNADLHEEIKRRSALHDLPDNWPIFIGATAKAEEIIRKLGDAACELIITRNGLTADDEERDMAEIKEDVFAVLMGHDTGCLDPEDLDTENNEYLWLEQALQELQETALLFGRRE